MADVLPKRERGRPSAQWFTAAELATWLDVPEDRLVRSLTGEKLRRSLWPNAEQRGEAGEWLVPERDLLRVLGPGIPRPLWVSDFAEVIGYSVAQVSSWIRAGLIPTVLIFGKRRVLESVLWELPKHMPAKVRKCPKIPAGRKAA